jgi:predicted alpha/beta-hydrolase family hydrolase
LVNRQEVEQYHLSSSVQVHWIEDGDHSFTPRKASGRTEAQNWQAAMEAVEGFLASLTSR